MKYDIIRNRSSSRAFMIRGKRLSFKRRKQNENYT